MTIGARLRDARRAQHHSLTNIAGKAGISAATLSRIETDKQGIDLALFLTLARVLKVEAHELLGEDGAEEATDPMVKKIAALASGQRAQFWRELAVARRERRRRPRGDVGAQMEELLAQFDYIRQEIETVRSNVRRR